MDVTRFYLKEIDKLIKNNDLSELKNLFQKVKLYCELKTISSDYIFAKSFMKSCYNGNRDIILWITNIYKTLSDIEKIAVKDVFKYGKYIIRKHKNHSLNLWYETHIYNITNTI